MQIPPADTRRWLPPNWGPGHPKHDEDVAELKERFPGETMTPDQQRQYMQELFD